MLNQFYERPKMYFTVTTRPDDVSRNRGFFDTGMLPWALLAISVFVGGWLVAIQTDRLDRVRAEFATYRGGVEALGRAAEVAAARQKLADIKAKERADEEIKVARVRGRADADRVRHDIAGRGILPPSATAPGGAPGARVDWALVDAALREFAAEAAGIAAEGADAVGALDALKRKAQSGAQ